MSTSTGVQNTAIGTGALQTNTTGSNNTAIGAFADVSLSGLTNATAIGANAVVSQSNSLILGNNANVGIGTSAPPFPLSVETSSLDRAGDFSNFGTGTVNRLGITAGSYGTGTGNRTGAQFDAAGGTATNTGVIGFAQDGTTNYGVRGIASGTATTNIGGQFSASGATNNFAIIVPSGGGNVGIGTTPTSARLVTRGAGNTSATATFNAENSSGTSLFYVRDDGNVGIGTTSPTSARLVTRGAGNTSATATFNAENSSGTSLFYVRDDGNVGIGTTSPGWVPGANQYLSIINSGPYASGSVSSIEIKGNTNTGNDPAARIDFLNGLGTNNIARIESRTSPSSTANGGLIFYTKDTSLTARMRITHNGNVGIGTTNPGGQLELSLDQGRKPATSSWTIVSDARLKTMEGVYSKGLKEILQLQPITYHYKNVGERKFEEEVINTLSVGFIAQDVQKIFPEAVGVDADGYLNFNMHSILVAYTNAIKELKEENDSLKLQVSGLKQEIEKIKMQLGIDAKAEAEKKK